ncbi:MAG: beta-lactamase family protein [Bacteroidetes bacterium]|nr:beta-lactamase family protein [Bacteroidota bacterium]
MKKFLLTLCIAGFFSCFTFCQNQNDKHKPKFIQPTVNPALYQTQHKLNLKDTSVTRKIAELSDYFDERAKNSGFSAAVLISFKGTPIFERYYGYKNYKTKEPITSTSTFQIASTSKTFTSGAILLLAQQKLLSLEDSIETYFPNFPYKGITIRMLLNHRSGLPKYLTFSEQYWKRKDGFMNNEDVLNMLYKYKPKAIYPPNTHFLYTNTNFVLLALIVEKVSGMPFCDFIHQNIFVPLGMNDTWYFDPKNVRTSATKGYTGSSWVEDEIVPADGVMGDKGIYSTVRDLYKWDQALNSGNFIKPAFLGLAYTPQSFEKIGNKNYGLGWRIADQPDGTRLIYHNGWWHSYNSVFYRKISDNTTVIILSNHYNSSIYKIQPVWDILYENGDVKSAEDE